MVVNDPGTIDVGLMKWAIGGLCGFIVMLILWIKQLIDKNDKLQDDRLNDLKDLFKVKKGE